MLSPMTLLPTLWIQLPSRSLEIQLMPPKLTNFQLYPPLHWQNFSLLNTSMHPLLLIGHSDNGGKSVEQAVDLNASTDVEYEQKDDGHGVRYI